MAEQRMCKRCIMDTSDPEIIFDEQGVCNHCRQAMEQLQTPPACLTPVEKKKALSELVLKIKAAGKNRRYDCVIGLSGGIDSTYAAYYVKKLGLRPLAVHLDNGWDAELAVKNIENICRKLGIDLYTHVIDWEEFKDLQLSFLKASTPDSEVPSDHAIRAILYKACLKYQVKYILAGTNSATESILPRAWSRGHSDWRYINGVQKMYGRRALKTFPHYSQTDLMKYEQLYRIKWISILDYIDYQKTAAKQVIANELGWQDYGGKHHESVYTKFFQSYILPIKFGYDKRKAHLSSLICSGQISRQQALQEIKAALYSDRALEQGIDYVINKFGISRDEFQTIIAAPPKSYSDYPNSRGYEQSWYFKLVAKLARLLRFKAGVRR